QSTVATEGFKLGVSSQGTAQMVITPVGNQGNYFSGQSRQSTRIEWIENYALKPLQFKGTHNIQFGTTAAHSEDSGRFFARPVLIKNTQGVLLRRINFAGGKPFSRSDVGLAAFGEDHWSIGHSFSLDAGMRVEQQSITATSRLAPRFGFVWVPPLGAKKTTVRGGSGGFFDHVPLNVYVFPGFPRQILTPFHTPAHTISPPPAFL